MGAISSIILLPLLLMVLLSCLNVCLYGYDKHQAKKEGWRVPEQRLLMVSLLGGWPGALFAQGYFRHKTQKSSFRLRFYLCAVVHVLVTTTCIFKAVFKQRA